jgi:uncharacterized membrane protein
MSNPYDENPSEPNPYQQNPYQQNPYQQNPYGQVPQPHPQGTTVLVLGIVGLVVCFIAGIVGLVIGNKALKEIDANPGAYNNRQNVVVGRILSIIGIVLQVIVIVGYLLIVVVAIGSSSY